MPTVHVFVSRDRFTSEAELDLYVHPKYTEDGDVIDSQFMREVGLEDYEPMCIEAIYDSPQRISLLLRDASYSQQWLEAIDVDLVVDAAICIYEPNLLKRPEACSLSYLSAFEYQT